MEIIALEIITGGVSIANDLILANMALEIITAGDCSANVTISKGELMTTCHCIHPIHIMSYNIGLFWKL